MAEKAFKLEVITPDRVVLSDDQVVSVVAPGSEGYLGVQNNHAPLMAALKVGHLNCRKTEGASDVMALSGGFIEVFENKVTVLAETAELAEEIDVERAERSLQRAEERIANLTSDIDLTRAQAALQRALNRLKVARREV